MAATTSTSMQVPVPTGLEETSAGAKTDLTATTMPVKSAVAGGADSSSTVDDTREDSLVRTLATKFECALSDWGYDETAHVTVNNLVTRNLVRRFVQLDPLSAIDGLSGTDLVEASLRELLSGGVRINSNEPVLLLTVEGAGNAAQTVLSLKEKTCMVLRDAFHIFPVRVYVLRSADTTTTEESRRGGFGVALLNVVNTDIGGPSMIQLLDNMRSSPGWDQEILVAEAWNRTDLLWQDDRLRRDEVAVDQVVVVPEAPQLGLARVAPDETIDGLVQSKPVTSDEIFETGTDVQTESVADENEASEPAVHPAMTELLARESSRPTIQHPSWDHTHSSDSLFDIIQKQSSSAGVADAEEDVAQGKDKDDKTLSHVAPSRESDADFELL